MSRITRGTRLFRDGDPDHAVVIRDEPGHMGAERYVSSFLAAAEALADRISERPEDAHALVLPTLFAYRHWLELRLKALVIRTQRLRRDLLDPIWTHNLEALWTRLQPRMELCVPDLDRQELAAVRSIVIELSDMDPGSVGFRYAITRSGEVSLSDALLTLDFAHFRAVMDDVVGVLEHVSDVLLASLEWEQDIRDWDEIDY
jgi:hypothetical protein